MITLLINKKVEHESLKRLLKKFKKYKDFILTGICRYHLDLVKHHEFKIKYGFLYVDYKSNYYYWDSIVMLRKLAIVVIVVFLGNDGSTVADIYQVLVALGLIIAVMVLQVRR